MADLIKKIKIKKQDGTFTDYIPIGAEAQNISTSDGDSVQLKLNKKPYYYNTVADMKSDTKLKDGDMAVTLGYYGVNDGGGAEYKITLEESETEYQEELESGLYAELITDDINLNQFGCYGDGIHDDTSNFKKAIDYAFSNNKWLRSSDNKTYLLTEKITIPDINIDLSTSTLNTNYGIEITAAFKELNFPRIIASELVDAIGLNLLECHSDIIKVPLISNFKVGLQLSANTSGCVNNNITIQEIRNCLQFLKLKATNSGWINENIFIGGRLWATSTFNTSHASDIIKIFIDGTDLHKINNNYFLKQDIEGNEGASDGLKIKMINATYNIFDNLRYEGTTPKVDATNSSYNVLRDGFYLSNVVFINDPITKEINGNKNVIKSGGDGYIDFTPSSNTNEMITCRDVNGNKIGGLNYYGYTSYSTLNGNPALRYGTGIEKYNDGSFSYIIRPWGKWTLMTNCNFTNGGLVITPGANLTDACFLWVNNGHLYGKIGTPSTATDGTIIL